MRRVHTQRHNRTAKPFMAQARERQQPTRDLHEYLSQRLDALALDVGSLERSCESKPELMPLFQHILKVAEQLTDDIHTLSHRLHPFSFELDGAIRDYVGEVTERTQVKVQYVVRDVPKAIPIETIICLYRVVQESLKNALKEAEVSEAEVRLLGTANGVGVCISDNGTGFIQKDAPSRGRGLLGMGERVRSLQGTFHIRTHSNKGRVVRAWVPLPAPHSCSSEAS